ncbi:hypothetical protein D9611_013081 [Ephemerocybe angulata]|uniref:HMG box domain-containing protein n=1 Tax=Ephemerocybe angulata TaxID=980116 RepID=A0A8H5BX76_9AGAR|nr:hypothetical protein D9611_013081 [Tulosesus angulatus]
MDIVYTQAVEDDDMPPLVDIPPNTSVNNTSQTPASSQYTFQLDTSRSFSYNVDASQVIPSTITLASSSSSNIRSTPDSRSTRSSPMAPQARPIPSTSSSSASNSAAGPSTSTAPGRPRSKSARGAQTKKREAGGHIPRPPNAFILFRSSFIRSQHIPDKVEGNHSNLSKIIGHYWKALSAEERAEWEGKAQVAQEEHRQMYPDWRFRPGPYAMAKQKTKDTVVSGTSARRRGSKASDASPRTAETQDDGERMKEEGAGPTASKTKKGKEKEGAKGAVEDTSPRWATIAGFLKEGKKGSQLTLAVEEWEGMNKIGGTNPSPSRSGSDSSSQAQAKSKMKVILPLPIQDDRQQSPHRLTTPQSPSATSIASASSPDRHSATSAASISASEGSPDLGMRRAQSHSPTTTSQSPSSSTSIAHPIDGASRGSRASIHTSKPTARPLGQSGSMSSVPLTQMFVNTPRTSSTSTPTPTIADLCPPTRFELGMRPPSVSASASGSRSRNDSLHAQSDYSKTPTYGDFATVSSQGPTYRHGDPYASPSQSPEDAGSSSSYWGWGAPPPSDLPRSGSISEGKRREMLPPREMGYEVEGTVTGFDTYGKNFTSSDLPPDGSEVTTWSTPTNRHGLVAEFNDPLDEPPPFLSGPSYGIPTSSSACMSRPHGFNPQLMDSQAMGSPFYYTQGPVPNVPHRQSTGGMNSGTFFSTLAGWNGGEYIPEPQSYSYSGSNLSLTTSDLRSQLPSGSDHDASSSKLPIPSPPSGWYTQQQGAPQWSTSAHDMEMGMVLSEQDWDKVDDSYDPRTRS